MQGGARSDYEHLKLHPALTLVPSRAGVQIRGLNDNKTISDAAGKVGEALVEIVNGSPVSEVISRQENGKVRERLNALVTHFVASSILVPASRVPRQEYFFEQLDYLRCATRPYRIHSHGLPRDPNSVVARLSGHGVLKNAIGSDLRGIGMHVQERACAEQFHIRLVCTDMTDFTLCRNINTQSIEDGKPTLYVSMFDHYIVIGPFVFPGDTGCYECYFHRLRSNVDHLPEFDAFVDRAQTAVTESCPRVSTLAARMCSSAATLRMMTFLHDLPHYAGLGEILTINTISLRHTTSKLVKLPRCTVCGSGGTMTPSWSIRDVRM